MWACVFVRLAARRVRKIDIAYDPPDSSDYVVCIGAEMKRGRECGIYQGLHEEQALALGTTCAICGRRRASGLYVWACAQATRPAQRPPDLGTQVISWRHRPLCRAMLRFVSFPALPMPRQAFTRLYTRAIASRHASVPHARICIRAHAHNSQASEDPSKYHSELTGRGPLSDHDQWVSTASPVMTAYILLKFDVTFHKGPESKVDRATIAEFEKAVTRLHVCRVTHLRRGKEVAVFARMLVTLLRRGKGRGGARLLCDQLAQGKRGGVHVCC